MMAANAPSVAHGAGYGEPGQVVRLPNGCYRWRCPVCMGLRSVVAVARDETRFEAFIEQHERFEHGIR